MAVTIQVGHTGTVQLVFKKGGIVVSPPITGGSVSSSAQTIVRNLALAADQKTVSFNAVALGVATISYTGPAGSGITASETVTVVATEADEVDFDDTTFTETPTA